MKRVNQHPTESANPTGRTYWRSHGELHDTPEFRGYLEREFPAGAAEMQGDELSRRSFLGLMGASLALAGFGLSGCRRPESNFVPFAKSVEWQIPGELLHYATAMPRRGATMPLVVATTDGRPIKVEGNPLHPASGGGTDAFAQASILDLYDPDRSRSFLFQGKPSSKEKFAAWVKELRTAAAADRGASLAFLVGDSNSPTRARLQAEVAKQFPSATWCVWDVFSDQNEREAAKAVFGNEKVRVHPKFGAADVVLALDCDFLDEDEGGLEASRDFMAKRRVGKAEDSMNRLYVVENRYTITGGIADHRLRAPAGQIGAVAVALAKAMVDAGVGALQDILSVVPATELKKFEQSSPWITEAAKDLAANAGKAVVLVGPHQPGWVHALGWAINQALGGFGKTVVTAESGSAAATSLADLVKKIESGAIKTLVISGWNPVYAAPSDLKFAEAIKKVATVVHLGSHVDETGALATWHVPAAHYLESWGDGLAEDGSYVGTQPMILPLHGGLSELEVIAHVTGREKIDGPALIQETFKSYNKNADEATAWNAFLREGYVAGSAPAASTAAYNGGAAKSFVQTNFKSTPVPTADAFEVVLIPDYSVYDGRYANNGWMQEMPDPITKLTWDNAVLMNMAMAKKLGVKTSDISENFAKTKELQPRDGQGTGVWGDIVEISVGGRKIQAGVIVSPGHADHSVSIALGYGRKAGGKIATKNTSGEAVGWDAYPLRTTAEPYVVSGAKITRLADAKPHLFATTQQYFHMEGRALVRELPIETYKHHAGFDEHGKSFVQKFGMDSHIPPAADIYTNPPLNGIHKWGMAIDLNTCTGCNACVVACQAENNIPIVGKEQVRRGRVMHWIRMDRYYSTIDDKDADPQVLMQPVTCHHCESAPCETVCPVNATIHTEEGLNSMAYNRCIGTRYCANNCPYKVRRFNYFDYNQRPLDQLVWGPFAEKGMEETLKLAKNPNVTVRMRGVMEKCTFCVQRIEEAKIKQLRVARDSNNVKVPTDSFKVACQQVCPTEAIVFGDLNDPKSKVVAMKKQDRDYRMLEYLNIKPRLSYQARLRNPNAKMPGAAKVGMTSDFPHGDSH
ncbi:MAG: TAT-variant-translocated molybdopterin oxidoreductase [Verrucomicrobia bacterium]|nr:TAT-variant-translocated molybdopterin oxidoreductase [Verrucomicrobiota bacterium]